MWRCILCRLYNRRYYREDVALDNSRGLKLQCSHYRPCVVTSADGRLPAVVYCHCECVRRWVAAVAVLRRERDALC